MDNTEKAYLKDDLAIENEKEATVNYLPIKTEKIKEKAIIEQKEKKKEKQKSSLLLNSTFTILTIAGAGLSSVLAPQSVVTPYLASVAAGTIKASARALDELGEKFGLSSENAKKYGFVVKYPLLVGSVGIGFTADYFLSSIPLTPQLGPIMIAGFLGVLFCDVKRKVILRKNQVEEDMV